MKVTYGTQQYTPKTAGQSAWVTQTAAQQNTNDGLSLFDEPAATLDLSGEIEYPWDWQTQLKEAEQSQSTMARKPSSPKDESGRLTRRLVSAGKQGEVMTILSEAYQNLSEMLKAAMSGGEEGRKAMIAVKRLNKLIQRAQRKISDLDKEDGLRQKQSRAEKKQEELRVKQIKAELVRRITERKKREKNYLRDVAEPKDDGNTSRVLSPAELEAQVLALAQMMAQVSTIAVSADAGTGTVDVGGETGGGETGGGEVAVAEGEVSAEGE